jgi:hypothetical protein
VWGEPAALSVTLSEADRAPVTCGVNVIEIVQLLPAATLVPQVLVWLKSAAFVPVNAILVMDTAAVPMLESVIVRAELAVLIFWLPNASVEGLSVTGTPVPVRAAVWGEPAALSVTVTDAERAPAACGVNLTEIVQLPPPATLVPHVFVWLKSATLVPVMATLVIDNAPEPAFESVIVPAELVVFTVRFPNARPEGVSETCPTATPVPLRAAVWGEPAALSVTVTDAERAPTACGVNLTEIVQLAPAATLVPHVLVWLKSATLVPAIAMLVIDKAPEPAFESVIVPAELVVCTVRFPNARLEGVNETCAIPTPVPLRAAVWGEPAALSVTVTEADRAPAACGVNVTEIMQLAPAATLVPQVFVWLKSAILVPVIATLVIDKAPEPAFESVIACAALAVLTFWFPKERLTGVNETCATPTPVPLRVAAWGDPVALSVTVTDADRAPAACGVNVTEMAQLPPAATLVPHVLVWLKSVTLAPVIATLVIDKAPEPAFESVIVCAALAVLTFWFPNDRVAGVSETCATPAPVPLRAAAW